MKTYNCYLVAIIATAGVVGSANGQDATNAKVDNTSQQPADVASLLYRDQELSFDGFASGSLGQPYIDHISGHTLTHNGRFGAGAGVNYFFTRYLGVGGDAYSENTTGPFIDNASGNLIARLPIKDTGIAPYIFGGAGHKFDAIQETFGQAGAGIEFRFAPNFGFFVDARYVFPDESQNYGLARGGLRVSF